MSPSIMKAVGTPIEGGMSKEVAIKSLNTFSKSALINALTQIANQGPGAADGLKVGDMLSRLLGHPDPEVVAAACKAIGQTCYTRATEFLVACFQHPAGIVRAAALEAVGSMGPSNTPQLNENVAAATADAEIGVKLAALKAIGDMEAVDCFETVKACLQDPVPEVKAAAAESYCLFIGMSQEVESTCPEETRASLITSLCTSSRTRQAALNAVYSMGYKAPAACAPDVVSALGDKDLIIRMAAVSAMGAMGESVVESKECSGLLRGLLKDGDSGAKAAAASALAIIGAAAAPFADVVEGLLADDTEDTSGLALQIAGGAKRPPPGMRRPKCAAVMALGSFGVETYIAKISEALNDQNWEVRLCAAQALGMFGNVAKGEVSTLMTTVADDDCFPVRAMACSSLGRINETEALSRLVDSFEDSSHSVRLAAVSAVAEFGESAEEHSHEVFKLVNDVVGHVRGQAAKTLASMGSTGQNYASVVATMLLDEDPEVRASVCEALGSMGEAGAALADEISERTHDASPEVRAAAVEALSGFGYSVMPALSDQSFTKNMKVDGIPGGGVDAGRPEKFEGLGLFYSDIQTKKSALMSAGRWIEGVL